MNNYALLAQRNNRIDLRITLGVIIIFSLVTFISYLNELSKSASNATARKAEIARRKRNEFFSMDDETGTVQKLYHINAKRKTDLSQCPRLRNSYNSHMQNYFINSNSSSSLVDYQKVPLVVLYTKGLSHVFMERCLEILNIGHKSFLNINEIINGQLDFGFCEKINKKCNYLFLVQHPIDGILQNYLKCLTNSSGESCKLNNVDISRMSLKTYARSESSDMFNKIHYYLDKCHLNADICLFPSSYAEQLSENELGEKLAESVTVLDKMFSAVGIYQNLSISMNLFEKISGKAFTNCKNIEQSQTRLTMKEIDDMRESLANDAIVARRLYPDLVIYQKLHYIFARQVSNFKLTLNMKQIE
ncbi:DgyrCDS5733 [Dimorphilus gyrociliatus]|uniref:DgyrCDS5733 n=1 Tax=Dimorphilus gyrociliatus TaxID=2664684 RepID=A0A7I8VKS5_9ANNE|nr:DgyrCDS5733 [Dimorphilus gyrociliatus]